jgi:hypothetical protein
MTLQAKARLLAKREQVFQRFISMCAGFEGEMSFHDYSGADVYSIWYSVHQPLTGHLAPFSARAGEFVLRLSMLLALSCGRMKMTDVDVRSAIALYEYCEAKLQGVVIPFTPKGKLQNMVLKAVGTETRTPVEIRRAMRNFTTSNEADSLVQSLLASQDLIVMDDGRIKRAGKINKPENS